MMSAKKNISHEVSPKQVLDYFAQQVKQEKIKQESHAKVIRNQLVKATGGKSIVVSNFSK